MTLMLNPPFAYSIVASGFLSTSQPPLCSKKLSVNNGASLAVTGTDSGVAVGGAAVGVAVADGDNKLHASVARTMTTIPIMTFDLLFI
jgi:hypothetical protein